MVLAIAAFIVLHGLSERWKSIRKYAVTASHYIQPLWARDTSGGQLYKKLEQLGVRLPQRGCVWDVGANDGVWTSNSFYPVNTFEWNAFLFEPDSKMFNLLRERYGRVHGLRTAQVHEMDHLDPERMWSTEADPGAPVFEKKRHALKWGPVTPRVRLFKLVERVLQAGCSFDLVISERGDLRKQDWPYCPQYDFLLKAEYNSYVSPPWD